MQKMRRLNLGWSSAMVLATVAVMGVCVWTVNAEVQAGESLVALKGDDGRYRLVAPLPGQKSAEYFVTLSKRLGAGSYKSGTVTVRQSGGDMSLTDPFANESRAEQLQFALAAETPAESFRPVVARGGTEVALIDPFASDTVQQLKVLSIVVDRGASGSARPSQYKAKERHQLTNSDGVIPFRFAFRTGDNGCADDDNGKAGMSTDVDERLAKSEGDLLTLCMVFSGKDVGVPAGTYRSHLKVETVE